MRPPPEIWRQRLWLWVPAAVFFLVNATAFAVYRFGYADRVTVLKQDLKTQRAAEKGEEANLRHREGLLQRARINRQRVAQLYAETFSTRRHRVTHVTAEVISLAGKAGLAPRAYSYPEQEIQGYNLIKRSFIFEVDGTYLGLRKLVNLLELSDSFLTLESVALSERGRRAGAEGAPVQFAQPQFAQPLPRPPGPAKPASAGAAPGATASAGSGGSSELHISLRLSTLFAKDPAADPFSTPAAAARTGKDGG